MYGFRLLQLFFVCMSILFPQILVYVESLTIDQDSKHWICTHPNRNTSLHKPQHFIAYAYAYITRTLHGMQCGDVGNEVLRFGCVQIQYLLSWWYRAPAPSRPPFEAGFGEIESSRLPLSIPAEKQGSGEGLMGRYEYKSLHANSHSNCEFACYYANSHMWSFIH